MKQTNLTPNQIEELKKVKEQYGKMVEHLSDPELLYSLKCSKKLGKSLPEYIIWELRYSLNKANMHRLFWKMGYSLIDLNLNVPNPISCGLRKNFNEFMDTYIKFMNDHNELKEKLLP